MKELGLANKTVLAIIPHQDDEVIGMGGVLAHACLCARSVHVVLVTDGAADSGCLSVEGFHPCMRWNDIAADISPGTHEHDLHLARGESGEWFHPQPEHPLFPKESNDERVTGFACPEWGRRRDEDFLRVCEALGVGSSQVTFAFHDPDAPEHIKDGQTAVDGRPLSPEEMAERYAQVAGHYIKHFQPDVLLTTAPYEFTPAPNDHWAMAHGAARAAEDFSVARVFYHASGRLYRHIHDGGALPPGLRAVELPEAIWEIKRRAIGEYFRWDPTRKLYATAGHSVPQTFRAILQAPRHIEYILIDHCAP
ncbi:MAG TPA: PIG-L family deacetylase [Candidatus Sumerlaeota bacterium]|nr:PIG-L family deacetylase [Candidatus Sumerlaeota bacterium]